MADLSKIRKNGVDYNLKDAAARADIEELKTSGTGGGLSTTAKELLITILRNSVFSSDQSANITALEAALAARGSGGNGGSGGSGDDTPDDTPTVTDDITVVDGVMTINSVGSAITVVDGVMTIA
jgi:hypothetical protein